MRRTITGANTDPGAAALLDIGKRFPAFGKALAHQGEGDHAKARAAFQDLIDQPALTALCLHQLGAIAVDRGECGRGAELLRHAIRLDPNQGLFYRSLGTALERVGDIPGAISTLVDLAIALQRQEKYQDCIPCYQRALSLDPLRYGAWINLGTALASLGQSADAVNVLLCGVGLYGRLVPEAESLANLLVTRISSSLFGIDRWQTLPAGQPTGPIEKIEDALVTLGKALSDLRYPEEAQRCYQLAVTLAPGHPIAHWNYALNLLSLGKYRDGWREYEWRWLWDRFPEPRRFLPMPLWRGEDLKGKRLYVFTEQGYGDALQFAPLVPRLVERDVEIVFEVTTPLTRLFDQSLRRQGLEIVRRPEGPHSLSAEGPFDFVVAEMSIPALIGLDVADLPLGAPWITVAPGDAEYWAARLPPRDGRPRVGLVWAGRSSHPNDAKRSMSIEAVKSLVASESALFVSLQFGATRDALRALGDRLIDTADGLKDFADTAALIEELDLVIAVDTAVAHLAGAMGKTVWLLLPASPDWRWGWHGETSAWYPAHRLFRQSQIGDWGGVIARVITALKMWA